MTNQNTNPDYYKGAEKIALVRLCGVLGVLTENNDLSTAALLAATRIESLEKKIPALNVDLAEASMHAYNGEVSRMNLEAELARRDEIITRLKEDGERLAIEFRSYDPVNEITACVHCGQPKDFDYKLAQYFYSHAPDCPITLHRALMKELE